MFERLEKIQIIILSIILATGLIVASLIFTGAFSKDQISSSYFVINDKKKCNHLF